MSESEPQGPCICLTCIGDQALTTSLESVAADHTCAYCGEVARGVTISELAAVVADPLLATLRLGEVSPHFTVDSDTPYFEQDGELLTDILQDVVGLDDAPAHDLADALVEQDPADERDGGEPFFQSDQLYERDEVHDGHYAATWNAFAARVTHRRRFFDAEAEALLAEILGARGSTEVAQLPITMISAEAEIPRIFRARRAPSDDSAERYVRAPMTELAPPPPTHATPGRMNPAGISVFYGAVSERVAVAEVRPSVGGVVAVASFRPSRPLTLLDLTRLSEPSNKESIFAPGFIERAARRQFLQSFHSIITRPVQPQDEVLEYLPTQAVAEYVRNVLAFDGIVFASTQTGTWDGEDQRGEDRGTDTPSHADCNVVVFGDVEKPAYAYGFSSRDDSVLQTNFPLTYEDKSAHVVLVSQVTYGFETIYMANDLRLDSSAGEEVDF